MDIDFKEAWEKSQNQPLQTYIPLPTKKDIIQRLFIDKHITFDEMWTLLQDNEGVKYITLPQPYPVPYYPYYPPSMPWVTCIANGGITLTGNAQNSTQ